MKEQQATFASGCFWCTEAVFQNLKGVSHVVSGYIGGELPYPTYDEVCSGNTGHAEAIQFNFDPEVITYEELLLIFFKTHDPTTLNRQGNDRGTQYRSAIFYHNEEQRSLAEALINRLESDYIFSEPIVTQVVPATIFYPAEAYHQNFFQTNPHQSYCMFVIQPKLNKFIAEFHAKLKSH
jgi:peptide-methionine (S)-S-oxide reductase